MSLPGPFWVSGNPGRAASKGVGFLGTMILFSVWCVVAVVCLAVMALIAVGWLLLRVAPLLWQLLLLPFRCLWWLAQVTWDGIVWLSPRLTRGVASTARLCSAAFQDWQHRNDPVAGVNAPWAAAPVVPAGWTDEAD